MNALTVDTEGAARHIGLAASTREKMRVYGDGPLFVKLGRSVRYRLTDLEAYLAMRVVESTSQKVTTPQSYLMFPVAKWRCRSINAWFGDVRASKADST